MYVAQTIQTHLLGFCVVFVSCGEILLKELCDTGRNLVLIALCLGNDRLAEIRSRELYLGNGIAEACGGKRIIGVGVDQLDGAAEVAVRKLVGIFCRHR